MKSRVSDRLTYINLPPPPTGPLPNRPELDRSLELHLGLPHGYQESKLLGPSSAAFPGVTGLLLSRRLELAITGAGRATTPALPARDLASSLGACVPGSCCLRGAAQTSVASRCFFSHTSQPHLPHHAPKPAFSGCRPPRCIILRISLLFRLTAGFCLSRCLAGSTCSPPSSTLPSTLPLGLPVFNFLKPKTSPSPTPKLLTHPCGRKRTSRSTFQIFLGLFLG